MSLSEIMLPEFDREMVRTRRLLAAIKKDMMDWKPEGDFHTILWNANHLVEIVGWTPLIIEKDEFDMSPVGEPRHETPSVDDPQTLLDQFDENLKNARAALLSVSDEQLAMPWSLKSGGQTYFTVSKAECIRTWVLNHCVHHRAVLSVYLRMSGEHVTPVYDE